MNSKGLIDSSQRWITVGLDAFTRQEDLDLAVHHFGVATSVARTRFAQHTANAEGAG